jgi:hypothetical protein
MRNAKSLEKEILFVSEHQLSVRSMEPYCALHDWTPSKNSTTKVDVMHSMALTHIETDLRLPV